MFYICTRSSARKQRMSKKREEEWRRGGEERERRPAFASGARRSFLSLKRATVSVLNTAPYGCITDL